MALETVAEALGFIHKRGIAQLDIRLSNVFMSPTDLASVAESKSPHRINAHWRQAGIQFYLAEVVEVHYHENDSCHGKKVVDLHKDILSLSRGSDGKMANKDGRSDIFLNHLMKKPPFDPTEAYNIWIYDFIGYMIYV